jgi:glucosyl-3-phosphoglycerate synthase
MDHRAETWYRGWTSHWQGLAARGAAGRRVRSGARISVVMRRPGTGATVAGVVGPLAQALAADAPLVDELRYHRSDSRRIAERRRRRGAVVHRARTSRRRSVPTPVGRRALWKSLWSRRATVLVFVDADLTQWGPHFVTGLLGPLLADADVQLVKGFYARVRTETDGSVSTEGGRVTELVARPLLSLWWPHLAGVVQPLAGEWAARRALMESLSVPVGYGVELATLLDTVSQHGLDAVAQVDLGSRAHRHQADHDLAVMAAELLAVAERRRSGRRRESRPVTLEQFEREDGQVRRRSRPVPVQERPHARIVTRVADWTP